MSNKSRKRLIFSKSPGKNQPLGMIHMSMIINRKKPHKDKVLEYPKKIDIDCDDPKKSSNHQIVFKHNDINLNKSNSSDDLSILAPQNSFIENNDTDGPSKKCLNLHKKAVYKIKNPHVKNMLSSKIKHFNLNGSPKKELKTHSHRNIRRHTLNAHEFRMASLSHHNYRNSIFSTDLRSPLNIQEQKEFRSPSNNQKFLENLQSGRQPQDLFQCDNDKFKLNALSTSIDEETTIILNTTNNFNACLINSNEKFGRIQTPNRNKAKSKDYDHQKIDLNKIDLQEKLENNEKNRENNGKNGENNEKNQKLEINKLQEKFEKLASIPPFERRAIKPTQLAHIIKLTKLPNILINNMQQSTERTSQKILTERTESGQYIRLKPLDLMLLKQDIRPRILNTDRPGKKDLSAAYLSPEYSIYNRKDSSKQDCIKPMIQSEKNLKTRCKLDSGTNRLLPTRSKLI